MAGINPPSARTAIAAAEVVATASVAGAVFTLAAHASPGTIRAALAAVAAAPLLVLVAAVLATRAMSHDVISAVSDARALAGQGQADVRRMADQVLRGDRPSPPSAAASRRPNPHDDAFRMLMADLRQFRNAVGQAFALIAETMLARPGGQTEIFVNLAWRMQSIAHRAIGMLDEIESKVEDPDLLKGLFTVDHLTTLMRRQSESLAVIGGSASRRQWNRPVGMQEVLRAAVAEVEHYSRVKIVPPAEGVLRGSAVSDVIHLVAELIENATKFSSPACQVLLRAQAVQAGIAVEVEDRGLGMTSQDQEDKNRLLAEPGQAGIPLGDGRIGLYVVAVLASQHGIRVQLRPSIYGGVLAVIILPAHLLDPGAGQGAPRDGQPRSPRPELVPGGGRASERAQERQVAITPDGHETPGPGSVAPARPSLPKRVRGERRPLPVRQPQASPVPGLRGEQGAALRRAAEEPTSGLMADFLGGVSDSAADGRTADGRAAGG